MRGVRLGTDAVILEVKGDALQMRNEWTLVSNLTGTKRVEGEPCLSTHS
jgi:hypothetical protein